ncbi:MAG TPA: adenylate/guanylate cyclase domain-containing protein [Saprospiraceae bacterium]|nr:adenylate/guanylate cyclase domain-containing protein [Saprospiraceae bacterium]
MNKKTIISILVCVLLVNLLGAQSDKIKQLEEQIKQAKGAQKIELLIALADAQMYAGALENAIKTADKAEDLAEDLKLPELRANALNREGKALLLAGKKRPEQKFEQSLKVLRDIRSNNKSLAMDNLENMRSIARKSGKTQEEQLIEAQIVRLKSGGTLSDAPVESKQEMQKELTATQRQLLENQQRFRDAQSKMLEESKALQEELAAREAELEQMTQEQMKTSMILMQQKLLLDSVYYTRGMDSLAVSNANLALREAESNRKFNYSIIGVLLLIAGGSLFSFLRARQNARILEEKNKTIREEQQRSDNLLLNILPTLVADELKRQGRTKARYFEDVGVLFADFVGFSKIAEKLTPQQLVSELDTCFQKFDEIIARYGLEKIKTIGDAYMCAGGLPDGGGSQLKEIVAAAMDMQAWLAQWNDERDKKGLPRFDARIGVHKGPVVAGVVGSKKFAFDIWGDTVNIAARVEQAGEGGRINISGEVYQLVKDAYPCHYRGKIAAKNKGEIDMYFVEN